MINVVGTLFVSKRMSKVSSFDQQETEKIIAELNETWEEKLRRTEAIRMERLVKNIHAWFYTIYLDVRPLILAASPCK